MGPPPAVITSKTNARVKQLRAAFSRGARKGDELAAIEGEHLVLEAIRSDIAPDAIFLTPAYPLPKGLSKKTEVVRLAEDIFFSAVETRTPQGIAALIRRPSWNLAEILRKSSPLLLILVGLQDPGNLGTLVRSAEAFGVDGVLTTPGTVNEWNQKALRASVGSTFRVPIIPVQIDDIIGLRNEGIRMYAAVGQQRTALPAQEADLRRPCALMIGNEGAGISDEWLRLADQRITIPYPGPVESLNAAMAGSLLLYEASCQRSEGIHQEHISGTEPRRPTEKTP